MKSLYKEFTTWIYSCHPEPGPSNCTSEAGLQVEYRVLCKAKHWLQTLGSRCLWFILRELILTCLDHNIPYSSQGFSTAFGKPASKFWTSQYTASCLDVLAMLASMVGFLCCSFNSFEAVGVDRLLQSSAIQRNCWGTGTVARLSSNVGVSASTTRPRTQYSIL